MRFAFQPGTFQIAMGAEAMAGLYRRAEVLICNREEAVEIGGGDHGQLSEILQSLHRLGPKIVVVTDGPEGAYASDGSAALPRAGVPRPLPAEGADRRRGRVRLRADRRTGQGAPTQRGPGLGPGQRDERGPGGRLADRPAERADLLEYLKGAPEGYAVTTW